MYICQRVKSKLELSLIRLWYTLAHQYNFNNQWWYRDFDGHLVNDWAAGPVSENETPDQKKKKRKTRPEIRPMFNSTELLHATVFWSAVSFLLCTYTTLIYLRSGFRLLKPAMLFSFISTHLLRQWNHAGALKWVGCGGEGEEVQLQVRGGGWREEMTVGNYTCETRHGAHTPLMQTAVLQENTENLRMFRSWSEYSYTHTHNTPTSLATYERQPL